MRFLALVLLLTACRIEPSQSIVRDASPAPSSQTTLLTAATELPSCTAGNQSQLFYVLELRDFVICDANNWTKVDIKSKEAGEQEAAAEDDTVLSLLVVGASSTNLCSRGECYWNGGKLVTMADQSKTVIGSTSSSMAPETEADTYNASFVVPKASSVFDSLLITGVTRGALTANVYLRYFRSPEKLALVFDSNQNLMGDDADEVLLVPTLQVFR